jgi:hypothetical protein
VGKTARQRRVDKRVYLIRNKYGAFLCKGGKWSKILNGPDLQVNYWKNFYDAYQYATNPDEVTFCSASYDKRYGGRLHGVVQLTPDTVQDLINELKAVL